MRVLIVGTVVAAVVVVSTVRIYILRDDSGGTLLWSPSQAYLFINVYRRGARVRYMEYPWMLLQAAVYGARDPDNQLTSVEVLHVTASGIERHNIGVADERPGNTPDLYKAADGGIYANFEGRLCKWTGGKFEEATEAERQHLESSKETTKTPEMWSRRDFGEAWTDYRFTAGWARSLLSR